MFPFYPTQKQKWPLTSTLSHCPSQELKSLFSSPSFNHLGDPHRPNQACNQDAINYTLQILNLAYQAANTLQPQQNKT